VTGDFNGDGKLDVAVVVERVSEISILLGNGDGTLQPHQDFVVGANPLGLAAGDFNGDGKLDLVVANANDSTVSVLLGNGDGTFQNKVDYPPALVLRPSWWEISTVTANSTLPPLTTLPIRFRFF